MADRRYQQSGGSTIDFQTGRNRTMGQTNNPNAVPLAQWALGTFGSGATRRTQGGQLENPFAPSGLDWLEANGPNRQSVQDRYARMGGQMPQRAPVETPENFLPVMQPPLPPEAMNRPIQPPIDPWAEVDQFEPVQQQLPQLPVTPPATGFTRDGQGGVMPMTQLPNIGGADFNPGMGDRTTDYSIPVIEDPLMDVSQQNSQAIYGDQPGLLPMVGRATTLGGAGIWDTLMNYLWRNENERGFSTSEAARKMLNR